MLSTIVPNEGVSKLVEHSRLAALFASDGFFVRVISR